MARTREESIFYYTSIPYNKKIKELNRVKEKTAWILANYPFTRNSDKALIYQYWRIADEIEEVNEENFDELTIAESITRSRRYIQNDLNLYLPTDEEIIAGRRISEQAVRDWIIRNKQLEED